MSRRRNETFTGRESEGRIVRAWQHDHQAGLSPVELRTRGLISKPGGNALLCTP